MFFVSTDPPSAAQIQILSSTYQSLFISWEDSMDIMKPNDIGTLANPISGYYLFHKSESSEWEEVSLPAKMNNYNLTNLNCGKRYQLYLVAYNEAGRGTPSQVISAKTDGSRKYQITFVAELFDH